MGKTVEWTPIRKLETVTGPPRKCTILLKLLNIVLSASKSVEFGKCRGQLAGIFRNHTGFMQSLGKLRRVKQLYSEAQVIHRSQSFF